ncbi:alpha-hydroxy acid oxidase [Kordia sp.]|uniref:alpha-hydroxy acid oxidase n=1 Tax=Kordia sp. TaxID=1965332 RepID=UPI0025BE7C6B|nr:alpha-hydroxy acid oxidase [Kordia sp.]MCH2083144.1 alpha-hydroxy-acid oxidizing protein [Saprospiraceae bacterium]MCH2193321.1 alpha-hydroxy-acid oxidizing protein [Kordia sp.]
MDLSYNPNYPSIDDLRNKAKKRIPRFAFEYLDGGCNQEINLKKNTSDIRKIELKPWYLKNYKGASMQTELFGHSYDAPFGIAPIGLQDLMWPKASEILATAAVKHNIPYILSTVGTASIEKISEITAGKAWFQLYHPREDELRDKLIQRAAEADYPVLVILSDTPTFGYRPKEIKNGLAIPPKMTISNILQIIGSPTWAIKTLIAGQPEFKTLKPYIPKGMSLRHLGLFMNKTFTGRMNEEKIKPIRDMWKGKLVLKGVASEEDTQKAIRLGLDGVIISNHGGRQLDAGQATIKPLTEIAEKYSDQIKVMMDSGIRSGPDIARTLASGAAFTFLGRSFMYGVSALGQKGGNHTISILKTQFQQVMEQLGCENVTDLPKHLIK